ncbi:dihydrolipoyllysine-residue acetyltransferase [Patulibacter sp. SYSU D01012]|uniref:dihydrolipoyllysine-residue acetyltransferase n=1 Tax=Patulibacter sp. SYSU D01012 TaxID=2817381 RepID=UPI001FEDE917|nr:dihydrolipoyllysine-residue acetyltransferase [Patulibacter sp. SYSU D01012]
MKQVEVPDIGDFEDVPVVEILVAVGDTVAEEDPLVALESDKATMEVPSPVAGTVKEILVSVGDTVSEGTAVVAVETGEEGGDDAVKPEGGDVSEDTGGTAAEPDAIAPSGTSKTGGAALDAEEQSGSGEAKAPSNAPTSAPEDAPIYASPSVRRLARELGVDLHGVQGTGRKGRIVPEDVQKAKDAPAAPKADAPKAADGDGGLGLAPWPTVNFEKFGETERVPLSRIQKLSGANLARNWVRIPHVTHNDDADITELEAFRKQLNAEQKDVKVTMVALLLKAISGALKQYPTLNSSLDGDELVLRKYHHLGFAADTPNGLLVPVIRDVDQKGILQVAGELTELSAKAREGKLGPAQMSGGTFSLSSLGGIGGTSFTPIINAPEVAILGVTRSAMKPVWNGSEFAPRLILPLSLSYDHRVIDGALAARFTAHLATILADFRRILL